MAYGTVDLLFKEWQALVRESVSATHAGRINRVSEEDLRAQQRCYALRIDAAYIRLKRAEERSAARVQSAASISG